MKSFKFYALTALVLVNMVACSTKEQTQDEIERVEQVKVMTLQTTQISREITLSSTLQGYETVNIAPSVTGKIQHIYVEEGSVVSKGQNLVKIDELQYKTAKLTYANLGVEMERMGALLKSGSVTQQAYDQLKLSYEQTKENLDFLEENTYVKAPFSGVIAMKNYEDGELYNGQPILVLTQISTLKAEVAVPESYFPMMQKGMKIKLRSDIYGGESFDATIETIFPTIDPASHTFMVKVRVPNAKQRLRPGMYVNADLSLGMVDAKVVPYQAVLKLQGSNERYVFLNDNGVAKRVSVLMGQRFDDMLEIISEDLKDNVQLVVVGQARLVEGVKLNIIK